MEIEATNGTVTNEFAESAYIEELSAEIIACTTANVSEQQREVAAKFLCEARSHARAGKTELAERKRQAARNVLNGKTDD